MANIISFELTAKSQITSHTCVKRKQASNVLAGLRPWYLLPFHLVYTIAFAAVVILILDGKHFAIGDRPYSASINWKTLYQSDISTLISIGLVLSRIVSSTWQSLLAWRCGFILLEKSSLKLSQFSRIVRWKTPASVSWTRYHWLVIITLLLAWPSQIAAPFASGGVLWIPATDFGPWSTISEPLAQIAQGNTSQWSWYRQFANTRQMLIYQAMALGNIGTPIHQSETGLLQPALSSQRVVVTMNYTDAQGTTIDNLTLPSFSISNFQWISNPQDTSQLPENFQMAVMGTGNLSVTGGENPLWNPIDRNAAILLGQEWSPSISSDLPEPVVVSQKAYAALLVSRNNDAVRCTTNSSSPFTIPPDVGFLEVDFSNNFSNCYLIASFDIDAGTARCTNDTTPKSGEVNNCTLAAGRLVAPSEDATPAEKLSDPLVNEVMALMPQTMQLLAASSNSYYPWDQKDPAPYLQDVLTRAYQGCWTSLNNYLGDANLGLVGTRTPSQVIQVNIVSWRIIVWAALNCCMGLAGVLLWSASVSCKSNAVSTDDPALTALLIDSSQVLEKDEDGLCNTRSFTRQDDNRIGRVGLRRPYSDMGNGEFHHYQLSTVDSGVDIKKSDTELALMDERYWRRH